MIDRNSVGIAQIRLLCVGIGIGMIGFLGCAKQGFPPGGPEDKSPPRIIETFPSQGATGVDVNTQILIRFDEWIQVRSPEEALFISPYPGEKVKIRVGSRSLRIRFPGPLRANTTYVITLSSAIRDLRGNALRESAALAFSTGVRIDQGVITGQVFADAPPRGIEIWAYRLSGSEDPDPRRRSPDYIVQCDPSGRFRFSHLAEGRYRLFAVKDRLIDRRYRPMEDEIGLSWGDASLDSTTGLKAEGLLFRMTVQDTASPRLERVEAVSTDRIDLLFSERVSFDSSRTEWIQIDRKGDNHGKIAIIGACRDPIAPRKIWVLTDSIESGLYRIFLSGITDLSGNPLVSESAQGEWLLTARADTARPRLVLSEPKPGARNILPETVIRVGFDRPVLPSRLGIRLADSTGQDVPGIGSWVHPAVWHFLPERPLLSRSVYHVTILGDSIRDRFGRTHPDSSWRFWTLNEDTLGGIAGQICDPETPSGRIVVEARLLAEGGKTEFRFLDGPGPYAFSRLLPGRYLISAFHDADHNGRYTHGTPTPFIPAERFSVYADTVSVRSRWTKEGIDLCLPRR